MFFTVVEKLILPIITIVLRKAGSWAKLLSPIRRCTLRTAHFLWSERLVLRSTGSREARATGFSTRGSRVSNIYYSYSPERSSASTIPTAAKSSNGTGPSAALPFASRTQPLRTSADWDPASVATASASQRKQHSHAFEQSQLQPRPQPAAVHQPVVERTPLPATVLAGRSSAPAISSSTPDVSSGTSDLEARFSEAMDQFSHSVHPAAAAAAAAAAAGAPGAHPPSTIVFDPNEFPSLAGPSVSSAAASAASLHANSVANGGPGVGLASSGGGGLGLGVVGSGANGTANLGVGARGPSIMSGLGGVAHGSELPHPLASTDYTDMYGLGAYGAGRGKAVDALTGANASSEFSMQSEDFPALGALGGKQPDSIFGPHPTALLTNPLGAGPPSQQALPPAHRSQPSLPQAHAQGQAQARTQQQLLRGPGFNSLPESMNGNRLPNGNAPGAYPQVPTRSEKLQQQPQAAHLTRSPQQGQVPSQAQAQWSSSSVGLEQGSQQLSSGSHGAASAHSLFDTAVPTSPKSQVDQQQRQSQLPSAQLSQEIASSQVGEQSLQHGSSSVAQAQGQQLVQQQHGHPPSQVEAQQSRPDQFLGQVQPTPQSQTHMTAGAQPGDAAAPAVDEHGMMGLLRVLKPGSDTTDLFLLSVGLDLTQLGLNLNSPDPLHATFDAPWDDETQKTDAVTASVDGPPAGRHADPDFKLPECYYMQPPALKTSHFTKFQLETLFYVFYNMPGDLLQLLAAVELNNREWRYHKELKLWVTRAPGSTATTYDRGPAYIYFDIRTWERRPLNGANSKFIAGLMTEEELTRMSNGHLSNAHVPVRS